MQTKGTVLSLKGGQALVRVFRESGCASCHNCPGSASCHAEFMLTDAPKAFELYVENTCNAQPGDTVEIFTENKLPLFFAFLTFILPLVLTVAAYGIADAFWSGTAAFWTAVAAFFVTFFVFAFVSNRLSRKFSVTYIRKVFPSDYS